MNEDELQLIYQEDESKKYIRAKKIEEEYRIRQLQRYEKYQKEMNKIEQEKNKKINDLTCCVM